MWTVSRVFWRECLTVKCTRMSLVHKWYYNHYPIVLILFCLSCTWCSCISRLTKIHCLRFRCVPKCHPSTLYHQTHPLAAARLSMHNNWSQLLKMLMFNFFILSSLSFVHCKLQFVHLFFPKWKKKLGSALQNRVGRKQTLGFFLALRMGS